MATNINKFETVTLADTALTEFIPAQIVPGSSREYIIRTAAANTGTIKFAIAKKGTTGILMANYTSYASGEKAFVTVANNESIFAQASVASQAFSIEY